MAWRHAAGVVVADSGASGYQGDPGAARARAGRRAVRRASRGAQRARAKNAPLSVLDRSPDRGRATAGGPRRTRTTAGSPRPGTAGTGPAWDDAGEQSPHDERERARGRAARREARRKAVNRRPRTGFGSPFGFYTTYSGFIFLKRGRTLGPSG